MSLVDDLQHIERAIIQNREQECVGCTCSVARIRSALIALESAQPEAEAITREVEKTIEDEEWQFQDACDVIAAALARAREADAKTIAELRRELLWALNYVYASEPNFWTNEGYGIYLGACKRFTPEALAKGKE
jgi:hypothetical protein